MKILLIGSGGRESVLAWKIAQSPMVSTVIVSPGNPGMHLLSPKIQTHPGCDHFQMIELAPDLVVIGPEAPLSEGLVDKLLAHKIAVVGPEQGAAQLEASKGFCKEIMILAGVPTADFRLARNIIEAADIIEAWPHGKLVVKTDELAQGKGVIVCDSKDEAFQAAKGFFDGSFLGFTVKQLIIEEKLTGPEVSAFALCDGMDFLYLGSATDYKRLQDGDAGPNTGGMGTISPSPVVTTQDEDWIKKNVFTPVLEAMAKRGTPFKGFLFAGLMQTPRGFKVLEFNVRLGDPEAQVLIPRILGDFVPLLMAAANGKLKQLHVNLSDEHALHVVMSAAGYPGVKGEVVKKGDELSIGSFSDACLFFPAGVSAHEGTLITSGGRVCGLTVLAKSLKDAREKAYQQIGQINFEGAHFRQDIGLKYV
jgi:phosphoribosylamine---glycine ligase